MKTAMVFSLAVACTVIGLGASCSDGQGMNGVVGFGMIEPDAQDASDNASPDAGGEDDAGEEPDVEENGQDAGVPEDISSTDTSSTDVGSEEDTQDVAEDVAPDTTQPDSGTPQCVPDCDGMECGADGCGGSCGTCVEGEVCHADNWTCVVEVAGPQPEGVEDCNDQVDNDQDGTTDCEDPDCEGAIACQPESAECSSPADCDDGDLCTTDSCDAATGCVHQNNTEPCEDGNLCTLNDHCSGGACLAGMPKPCADGNVNTVDTCVPATGECEHTPTQGPCDDGDPCTTQDMKQGGACKGTPKVCTDGNICTTDTCNATSGACQYAPNTAICNDGSACTVGDKCTDGVCHGGSPMDCVDDNTCTTDACDPKTGCAQLLNTKSCDDGNACTEGDKCKSGDCQTGTKLLDCDDADPATLDSCNPTKGCVHEIVPECSSNSDCDDGNLGTTDTCVGGECVYTPIPPQPECVVDADCDDGDDFTEDQCLGGFCLNVVVDGDQDLDGTIACGHPDAPLDPACDCDDSRDDLIGPARLCQSANGARFLLIEFDKVGTVPVACPQGTQELFWTDGSFLNGPQMGHDSVGDQFDNDCDGQVDEGPVGASCSFVPKTDEVMEVTCSWFSQL